MKEGLILVVASMIFIGTGALGAWVCREWQERRYNPGELPEIDFSRGSGWRLLARILFFSEVCGTMWNAIAAEILGALHTGWIAFAVVVFIQFSWGVMAMLSWTIVRRAERANHSS